MRQIADRSGSPPTAVKIPPLGLDGLLGMPDLARGLVLFAHGSGSSRHSPRNTYVAEALREARLATLLFDLLLEDEAWDRAHVFDIPLLAERLGMAASWAAGNPATRDLTFGYFGANTGAAAALVAAAEDPDQVGAVVSRGGRPDLAGEALDRVAAPTLLVVGGFDGQVINLNRAAYERLQCPKTMRIVPGAGHLFEEPGTLDSVIALARDWFLKELT